MAVSCEERKTRRSSKGLAGGVGGRDVTMVMPPIHLLKDSGETGGRGWVERGESLMKTKLILELRAIRLLRNTAGQVAAVEK